MPIAAFFLPKKLKHIFGILPTHWIFQSIDNLSKELPIGIVLTICFLFFGISLWLVSKLFIKKHFI